MSARSPKHPFASVALTVIGNAPVWSGVPERRPVAASSDIPVGRTPAKTDQVMVPTPPACVKAAPG